MTKMYRCCGYRDGEEGETIKNSAPTGSIHNSIATTLHLTALYCTVYLYCHKGTTQTQRHNTNTNTNTNIYLHNNNITTSLFATTTQHKHLFTRSTAGFDPPNFFLLLAHHSYSFAPHATCHTLNHLTTQLTMMSSTNLMI